MKYEKLKVLLSAYSNGEVSEDERKIVNEHLAHCSGCRETLYAYRNIRQKIGVLKLPMDDAILEITLLKTEQQVKTNARIRWRSPAWLAALAVIIIMVIASAVWLPLNGTRNTDNIIARAATAFSSVQSYYMVTVQIDTTGGQVSRTTVITLECVTSDCYHSKLEGNDMPNMEFISTGGRKYFKGPGVEWSFGSSVWESDTYPSTLTREYTIMLLESTIDVKKLPEDTINGEICFHYRGVFNSEMSGNLSATPRTMEFWIGKDDFLLRRMISNTEITVDGNSQVSRVDSTFSEYNAVGIDAPLDKEGNLLPGWSLITTSTTND
jgi:hypothetical protein